MSEPRRTRTRGTPGRSGRRLARGLALALLAALAALVAWGVLTKAPHESIDQSLSRARPRPAPAFNLAILQRGRLGAALARPLGPAVADGKLSVSELRGRRVVLNFWASWCVPCREEAPLLERTWREERPRAVLFLGLNIQDVPQDARDFMREFRIDYPNVRDSGDAVARRYGLSGIPQTFFLDRHGRIVSHVIGVTNPADLRDGIAATATGRPVPLRQGGSRRPTR